MPSAIDRKLDFGPIRNKSGKYDEDAVLGNPHSTFSIAILNVSFIFFFGIIDARIMCPFLSSIRRKCSPCTEYNNSSVLTCFLRLQFLGKCCKAHQKYTKVVTRIPWLTC